MLFRGAKILKARVQTKHRRERIVLNTWDLLAVEDERNPLAEVKESDSTASPPLGNLLLSPKFWMFWILPRSLRTSKARQEPSWEALLLSSAFCSLWVLERATSVLSLPWGIIGNTVSVAPCSLWKKHWSIRATEEMILYRLCWVFTCSYLPRITQIT